MAAAGEAVYYRIRAYVKYIHYVERLYEAAKTSAHGHFPEAAAEHAN